MEHVNDEHPGQGEMGRTVRAEIDTSAPFESVKEAATRFGGIGFWKPISQKHSALDVADNASSSLHDDELIDIAKLVEEAAQLERELIIKERETFDVLKELEYTKLVVEELKSKVQKEAADVNAAPIAISAALVDSAATGVLEEESHPTNNSEVAEEESRGNEKVVELKETHGSVNLCSNSQETEAASDLNPSAAPGLILLELKQAKLNLTRTTNDLAEIRAAVESYKQKIERDRISLEKTHQRLSSNVSKVTSLEKELNETSQKLLVMNNAKSNIASDDPTAISRELQRLSSETEEFKKMGEVARSEILKAMSEIEQTKARLKTADIRLIAARKMKEAARASEAVALAEIKALSNSENSALQPNPDAVTLTLEQYTSLVSKAREAVEASKTRVVDAMQKVDEANVTQTEILKKVEEATEEVKTSKKALEEALGRVEAANKSKLAVEEALRKWRSDRGQRRRPVLNDTKFKNSASAYYRRDSPLLDVNGIDLVNDDSKPVLKSTLSIGQILSRKLLLTQEYENNVMMNQAGKRKVSLGQMLGKTGGDLQAGYRGNKENHPKQLPAKRKKFGFANISFLVTMQSKKKKQTAGLGSGSGCRSL